nr:MAG TPA: hypothetical protein [Caudoviricetes sp.]
MIFNELDINKQDKQRNLYGAQNKNIELLFILASIY